ncbi:MULTISPECIES: FG-GAP-like repeat-containing protein [unclassified Chitinophaga]|uniref:FG-GAP-like repeat-containing protein n=1 Tax=unclassified Chitinophaga TaxID=2619133 RepID=UPI00300FD1FB
MFVPVGSQRTYFPSYAVSWMKPFITFILLWSTLLLPATSNAQINTSLPVGSSPGSVSNSSSGGSTYNLPIQLPDGTNGLMPKLSLTYSSQAGNGIAGVGWNIGGLSAVTRTGKNAYYNGMATPVNFLTTNDVFMLDGNRLFPISGANGDNATIYGTESETYAKIVSVNSRGNWGPDFFVVTGKDGTVMRLGDGSFQWGNNGEEVRVNYFLNQINDRFGNYMSFSYKDYNTDQCRVIDEIKYTGNLNTSSLPYNSIKFNYIDRTDKTTAYVNGIPVRSLALLSSIVITSNGKAFKTYQFTYAYNQDQPYLKSVKEIGADGSTLNPIVFDYGNNLVTDNVKILPPYPFLPSGDCITGDFDGDGKTDILAARYAYNNNGIKEHKEYAIYRNFIGFGNTGGVSFLYSYQMPATTEIMGVKENHFYNFMSQDYDGDGKDDVIFTQTTQQGSGSSATRTFGKISINHTRIYNAASGWTYLKKDFAQIPHVFPYSQDCKYIHKSGNFFLPGDFDGDGHQDYILILGINPDNSYGAFLSTPGKGVVNQEILNFGIGTNTGAFFATTIAAADNIYPLDIDGDGKTELLVVKDNMSYVIALEPLPATTGYMYSAKTIFTTSEIQKNYKVFPADYNGDGKTDLLVRKSPNNYSSQWVLCTSTGIGLVSKPMSLMHLPVLPGDNGYAQGHSLVVGDLNHDGKADLIHCMDLSTSSSKYIAYYSTGDGFYQESFTVNQTINGDNAISGDLNADGKTDCVALRGQTGYIVSIKPFRQERLLTKVTNGIGHVTNVNYRLFSDDTYSDFYQRSIPFEYADPNEINGYPYLYAKPYQAIKPSIYGLASIDVPDGIGGTSSTRFSYQDAILHKGKGFLGFLKQMEESNTTGIKTTTENEIHSTYFVPYTVKQTSSVNGTNFAEIQHTYTFTPLSVRRFFQKEDKVIERDLLNAWATETSNTYDDYGNIIKAESKTGTISGATVTPIETGTVTTTYSIHNTPVPSLPDQIVRVNLRTGSPAVTETVKYTYNATGLPETKISFAGLPKAVTRKLYYDVFGNIIQTDVMAAGLPTRTEKITFDLLGRYPTKREWIGSGITRSTTHLYDDRWGKPLNFRSIDGLTTTYEYDGFGRLTKTTLPEGYAVTQALTWETQGGVFAVGTSQPGGGSNTKIWYDILGREVRRQNTGFNSGLINQTFTYNARGHLVSQTVPAYTSEAPVTFSNTYDSYNRLTSETSPAGATTYSYQAMPGGLMKTTATAPGGISSNNIVDATGKVVSVIDNGGELKFQYNSWGNKTTVSHGAFQLISNTYDEYGRQTAMNDKDAGNMVYEYDAFGQLIKQVDANSNTYVITNDALGRITTRQGPEGITSYEYFNDPANGYSNDKPTKISGPGGVVETHEYDNLRRLKKAKKMIDGSELICQYDYDTYSNLVKTTYPSGLIIQQEYDRNGRMTGVLTGSGVKLFNATAVNSRGVYTGYTLGNGKASTITYDLNTGTPKRYYTPGIQDLNFTFETTTGNLTGRNDVIKGKTETFTYDNLNRLSTVKLNGVQQMVMNYDNTSGVSMGNIVSKTDAGNYVYNSQRVHAVNYITNPAGATTPPAVIPVAQQDITYTSFEKTATVKENSNLLTFGYGPDYRRVKSELSVNGAVTQRKYYLGDYEKQVIINGKTYELHYIQGGNGICAVIVRSDGVDKMYFVYVDHLGSLLTLTDATGAIVAQQNFDAWGRYRNPDTWQYQNVPARPDWLYRGYTGHEHLSQFGLVNMNGRMYDPVLGRMMSPDAFTPSLGSSQAYNRYTYANNNPLIFVDQDGNFWHILAGAIIGGAVNLTSNLISGNVGNFWQGVGYFATGAASGAVTAATGNAALGGAILGLGNGLNTQISAGQGINIGTLIKTTAFSTVTSVAGAGLGNAISPYLSTVSSGIAGPLVREAVAHGLTGAAVGFTISTISSAAQGKSLGAALGDGLTGAGYGLTTGLITGSISGLNTAKSENVNPWTGKSNNPVSLSPVQTAQATLPEISDDLQNGIPQNVGGGSAGDEMVRVRHHTSVQNMKLIKKSGEVFTGRGQPPGVDVELSPFLEPGMVKLGQYKRGAYVEFSVPKSQVIYPHPTSMGGTGNGARVSTPTIAPFVIKNAQPTYYKWNLLDWIFSTP